MWVRHCSRCGRIDVRNRYETFEQAEAESVVETPWTCPTCDSTEFTLTEQPEDIAHLPE